MKASDYFGIVVRTAGLLVFLMGIYDGFSAAYVAATPQLRHTVPAGWALAMAIAFVLIGLYLLRGARALVRFSYPAPKSETEGARPGH